MSAPAKTQGTTLLSLQEIATAVVVLGSAIDVTTKFAGTAYIRFGRCVATALGAGCKFRLEASAKSSGDGFWYAIAEWVSQIATAADEAVSGTESAGATVIEMSSLTGFAAGDYAFFRNTTPANSEWARVKASAAGAITLEEGIINAQTGSTVYDQAEAWAIPVDLLGIGRLRLVVDAASGPTGQTIAVEAWLVTTDTIG